MFKFKKITDINGLDTNNINNAMQNSYAWCMAELGDYIYVGTSRNMFLNASKAFGYTENNNLQAVPSIPSSSIDNSPEIWRYKKNSDCNRWERVFKTDKNDTLFGFRAMITHKSHNSCAIYAAATGTHIALYKSADGLHWKKIDTSNLTGKSSRALASLNGKLYIATLESGIGGNIPYLYASPDPETKPFKKVINTESTNFISCLNPMGGIDSLTVFNNKLYLGISTPTGAEIWRSDNCNPQNNRWTLIGDNGFGDSLNSSIMSTGIFKGHLYAAATKKLPLSLFMPFGFDLIRIDKDDKWELVVGGKPILPSHPTKGRRNCSISGFSSGFNSFFNIYGWQIQEYKDNLLITTYDGSGNVKAILDNYINNKDFYIKQLGESNYNNFIKYYTKINTILSKCDYPKGFDIYTSKDGCKFTPVILDGLKNPNNYGGRTLLSTCDNKLYLGTANPQEGLEVWHICYSKCTADYCSNKIITSYYSNLKCINKELRKIYPCLLPSLFKIFSNTTNTTF